MAPMNPVDYYHRIGVEARKIAREYLDDSIDAVERDDTDDVIEAIEEDIESAACYGVFGSDLAGHLGMQNTDDYLLAASVVDASNARFVDEVGPTHPRDAIRLAAVNTIRKDLHDAVFDELKMRLVDRDLLKPRARH